jgi:hypothetical protein
MEQMAVPRIEKTAGKFFDVSWPDYTDTMLRAGSAKASVDIANEDRLLKAQELEIAANDSAFNKLFKMAELGIGAMDMNARNRIAGERNSIDWFRTALEADHNRAVLAQRMQEFEINRQFKNAEIANRYNGLGIGMGSAPQPTTRGFRTGLPAGVVLGNNTAPVSSSMPTPASSSMPTPATNYFAPKFTINSTQPAAK